MKNEHCSSWNSQLKVICNILLYAYRLIKKKKKLTPWLLWKWNKSENEMVELSLVLFRVALLTDQTFQSFIISIFIYAWKCFIKNLKGIQVRLMTEICFVGKENSFAMEGQPCTLGRVKKMHNQLSTSISQLLNLTADFKMVKSHTKALRCKIFLLTKKVDSYYSHAIHHT